MEPAMGDERRTAIAATAAVRRAEEKGRAVTVKRALLLPLFALLWLCWGLFEIVAYLLIGPGDGRIGDE
jgi:hypothetical protein